jgi:hypothetical protein
MRDMTAEAVHEVLPQKLAIPSRVSMKLNTFHTD